MPDALDKVTGGLCRCPIIMYCSLKTDSKYARRRGHRVLYVALVIHAVYILWRQVRLKCSTRYRKCRPARLIAAGVFLLGAYTARRAGTSIHAGLVCCVLHRHVHCKERTEVMPRLGGHKRRKRRRSCMRRGRNSKLLLQSAW